MIEGLINAYGGSIVSNDGRKVTFDSPETVQAVAFLGDLYTNPKYKPMLPPGVAAWTDSSNNENWLAGILGYTRNQFSVYADSKTKKNPVYENTYVFSDCIGPATDKPLLLGQSQGFVVFKGAKNAALAKLLARYLVSAPALLGVAKEAPGLALPAWEKVWDADPFFTGGDPAFPIMRKITQQSLPLTTKNGLNFPQKASAGQQAAVGAYVLTDMMQQVIQGTTPARAVQAAHAKMVQIFNQQGLPQ
jgi:multiple sugar transport system substrate-binding protein